MTPADGGAAGDWIEWSGGECPVDGKSAVEIRVRDGGKSGHSKAEWWNWGYGDWPSTGDIVAYRVVQP